MLNYTALGDSITAGASASTPSLAYPNLVANALGRRGISTVVNVLAEPGWTSTALNHAVFENSWLVIRQSASVSIFVGGDDLGYAGLAILRGAPKRVLGSAIRRYARDLALLIGVIHRISPAQVIVCTQYNPFPNSPLAVEGIHALNRVTAEIAARSNAIVAPVHAWFEGRQAHLVAGYRTGRLTDALQASSLPIHPNNAGHRVIAERMAPMIANRRQY